MCQYTHLPCRCHKDSALFQNLTDVKIAKCHGASRRFTTLHFDLPVHRLTVCLLCKRRYRVVLKMSCHFDQGMSRQRFWCPTACCASNDVSASAVRISSHRGHNDSQADARALRVTHMSQQRRKLRRMSLCDVRNLLRGSFANVETATRCKSPGKTVRGRR